MAMKKDFKNAAKDQEKKEEKVEKLTVLEESDANTIYNLIFSEKKDEKGVQHQ